ncbi:hypothetical protein H8E77_39720 [bacterium]|nr:hypothetical protein [bacterium]
MATANQISQVRMQISDTDNNHYAFLDTEIGDAYDTEGTVLRTAVYLLRILQSSPIRMSRLFGFDMVSSDLTSLSNVIESQIGLLENAIAAEEEDDSQYEEDDDLWTWDWEDHLQNILNR